MNDERTHELRSQAIGQRIVSLRYDAESGYVVIEPDGGDELWVASCFEEGYHVVCATADIDASKRLLLSDPGCIVE